MPDNSPRPTSRKRLLIAPLVIFLVMTAIVLGAVVVHKTREKTRPQPAPVALPAAAPLATVMPEPPPLTRTELVQNANAAADAYAIGAKPSLAKSALIGRSFTMRIPFGCGGPGGAAPSAQEDVELDPATLSLKLTAQPATWTSLPLFQGVPGADRIEAVEGFWIPRPWASSEACPPVRDTPMPATPTPAAAQTLGLAQVFEKGGSRVLMRGGRPYQSVAKLPKDDANLFDHAFRLVLEGRIVGYGDGRAIHCWSESPDHRPICFYAVDYDRVAFEDAATGDTVAEWRD